MSDTWRVSVGWDEVFPEPVSAQRPVVTRKRILVAALITALALVGLGLLTDDPLERLGLGRAALYARLVVRRHRGRGGDTVYYVTRGQPGTLEIGYDVTNTGRLPVTVQASAHRAR